jgi:TonB family protein
MTHTATGRQVRELFALCRAIALACALAGCSGTPETGQTRPDPALEGLTAEEAWCESEDACDEYLREVRGRVADLWETGPEVTPGFVVVQLAFDDSGNLIGLETAEATDPQLEDSCLEAFRKAQPFPPPPESMVGKVFRARFIYGDHETLPRVLLEELEARRETARDPGWREELNERIRTLEEVMDYWSRHPTEPLPSELRKRYVSILEDI